jgi:hypothetical protein
MGAGKARHVTDQETGIHISLHNRRVVPHFRLLIGSLPEASKGAKGSEGIPWVGPISDNACAVRGVRRPGA